MLYILQSRYITLALLFCLTAVLQSHKFSSKSDQKQKNIFSTFFVNNQLRLDFNFLKSEPLNFAQKFRGCLFDLANSESGEKSRCAQFF